MVKRRTVWIVWIVLAAGIKIFSLFPEAVEKYYSQGIYPLLAKGQRLLFGSFPFSVGDLLYGSLILWLAFYLFRFCRTVFQRKANRAFLKQQGLGLLMLLLVVYVVFNALWGLNYNRKGIAWQLGIDSAKVEKEDLIRVMQALAVKVNELDSVAHRNRPALDDRAKLLAGSVHAYQVLGQKDKRFIYEATSLKPSLFHVLGNYLGYTGYYNPFTGEAQVNTAVPLFVQPFTSCHEIGHQLGYARENEANFAGYLAASHSPDTNFQYSVYFDLYSYGRPYLYYTDSMALKQIDSTLQPGVKADFRELKAYYKKYENPVERVVDVAYGQYLKANEQPDGKITYGKVVLWLVAYFKKEGKL